VLCPGCEKTFIPGIGRCEEEVATPRNPGTRALRGAREAVRGAWLAGCAAAGVGWKILCRCWRTAAAIACGAFGIVLGAWVAIRDAARMLARKLLRSSGWLVSAAVHALLLVSMTMASLEGYKGPGKSEGVLITDFTPEAQKEQFTRRNQHEVFKVNPEVDSEASSGNPEIEEPDTMPETDHRDADEEIAGPITEKPSDPVPALEVPTDIPVEAMLLSSPDDLRKRPASPTNAGMGDGRVSPPGPFRPVVTVRITPRGEGGTGGSRGPVGLRGSGRGASSRQASDSRVGKVLHRHWERCINRKVTLPKPSGWHFHYPWFVSSPAVGELVSSSPGLEVVTGTEEGLYEYFPLGKGQGRYICTAADGRQLWEYRTDNNAGRASPAIAATRGNGRLQVIGGSTSGWMVHCFDGATGKREWRHEVSGAKANILSAPAVADFSRRRGRELVAIALNGTVVGVDSDGKRLWTNRPFGRELWAPNSAAPAIADVDDDGRLEAVTVVVGRARCVEKVVTVVNGRTRVRERGTAETTCVRVTAHDANTGKKRWQQDLLPEGDWDGSEPGKIPPLPSPAVVVAGRRSPHKGRARKAGLLVVAFCGQMYALDGRGGKIRWSAARENAFASPAVGDLDGDGHLEIAASCGGKLACYDLENGKLRWERELVKKEEVPEAYRTSKPPTLLSGPALANRHRGQPGRIAWGMFRNNPARTGMIGTAGPHDIYVAGCDGKVYFVRGRDGKLLGRQKLAVPNLLISGRKVGALPYVSSPAVADIDGDGTLEVLVTMVDRLWCLKDTGSDSQPPDLDTVLVQAAEQKRPVIAVFDTPRRRCPGSFGHPAMRRAIAGSRALVALVRPPVLRRNADRRDLSDYSKRLKRYNQIAGKVGATVDPTLVCFTPEGICAGKVEAPDANEVHAFFQNAPNMSAAATAAARLAARSRVRERAERATRGRRDAVSAAGR